MLSETGGITNGKYQKTWWELPARRLDGLHTGWTAAKSAAEDSQATCGPYAKADGEVVTGAGDAVRDELQKDESGHRPVDYAGKVHGNLAPDDCTGQAGEVYTRAREAGY